MPHRSADSTGRTDLLAVEFSQFLRPSLDSFGKVPVSNASPNDLPALLRTGWIGP